MSNAEETVNGWLQQLNILQRLAPEPNNPTLKTVTVSYGGLTNFLIVVDRDSFVQILIIVGLTPQGNVAPLFRRMLVINSASAYGQFHLQETTNQIRFFHTLQLPGLQFPQFKAAVDGVCANAFAYVLPMKAQFQMP